MSRMLFLLMACLNAMVVRAEEVVVDGITYEVDKAAGTAVLTRIPAEGFMANPVVIPYEVEGCRVTSIGECAFAECLSLGSISLPEGLESIERGAFAQCDNLFAVSFPAGLKSIGDHAFDSCDNLCGDDAQSNLGYGITLPEGVEYLGEMAFYHCARLTSITLPKEVEEIKYNTFNWCSSLFKVVIPQGSKLNSIGQSAFMDCSTLWGFEDYRGWDGQYIEFIGPSAFENCSSLLVVSSLLSNAKSIGDRAFSGCSSLDMIDAGAKSIGAYAFAGCSSATMASVYGVENLAAGVFSGCTSLETVSFSFYRPKSIGASAFEGCSSLTSITLPMELNQIGAGAFAGCVSLAEFIVDEYHEYFYTRGGVLFNKETNELVAYPNARGNRYNVPAGVPSIGEGAFQGCTSLTSVTFSEETASNERTALGKTAFREGATSDEGLKEIKSCAFLGCSSLASVSLPESLADVAPDAFEGCVSLDSCYLYGEFYFPPSLPTRFYFPVGRSDLETYYGDKAGGCFVPVSIGSAGYSTYYCSKATKLPEGATGYVVKGIDANNCLQIMEVYHAGDIVPAGEALLLKGSLPKTTVDVEATSVGTPVAGNWLRGSDTAEMIPAVPGECYYKLSYDLATGEDFGFFWGAEDAGPFVNAAHNAYLAVPAPYATSAEGFNLDDSVTVGIDNVVADGQKVEAVYTLDGRRVDAAGFKSLPAGIYVVNGKKMVVR